MLSWILALAIGVVVAFLAYGRSRTATSPINIALALVRAIAVTIVAALALGAPMSPAKAAAPILALDASSSWRRTHDSSETTTSMRALARSVLQRENADQVILFGDSLREGDASLIDNASPADHRSALRPLIDRAAALGRPLVLVTDGEVEDPDAFNDAPAGSHVVLDTMRERPDAALLDFTVAASASAGDTLQVELTVGAGAAGAERGEVRLLIDGLPVASSPLAPLEPFATTRIAIRLPLPREQRVVLVNAVIAATNDHEARNDTLGTVVEITDRPPVAFVSTSPDLDVREALTVLRGALDLPVRAYLRIAPQLWREEGSLAPISEADVRSRAQRAGLLILHGDTAWGGLNTSTRGARALWRPAPPPAAARAGEVQGATEWYPSGAPASPMAAALAGLPWDTLPPIILAGEARGTFNVLDVKLGRAGAPTAAIAGREAGGVRTVVVSGSGYAGWALRGGRPAEAFTALWGAIFDWLAAGRGDERAARPAVVQLRAGEPVRWRRGGADSLVPAAITRRGSNALHADTVLLHFAGTSLEVETAALPQGVYAVQTAGGTSLFVVNAAREWLPHQQLLAANARVRGAVTNDAPKLADSGWPFILALLLLCAEWVGRRFAGLR